MAAWPQREAGPMPGAGRHSTLGLSQVAWGLGLDRKVLKVRGQETLWVPGTPCSTAGSSDVELPPAPCWLSVAPGSGVSASAGTLPAGAGSAHRGFGSEEPPGSSCAWRAP